MHGSNPFVRVNVFWASGLNADRILAGMAVRPFASTEYSACPLKRAIEGGLGVSSYGFGRKIWGQKRDYRMGNLPTFPHILRNVRFYGRKSSIFSDLNLLRNRENGYF